MSFVQTNLLVIRKHSQVERVATATDLTRIADKERADKVTYIIYGAMNVLLFHLKCI